MGAFRDPRVGSTNCVEKARGYGAWVWRVGMARGYGAPRGRRGEMARGYGAPRGRRVEMARVFGAPRGRRVETVPGCQSITTGGVQPPIHYPAGNYPRFQTGGGVSNIYRKFKKEREEDCKDWMKRKQKKRKPRKQTGGRRTGKKRKPRKQTGGRRTGKKRKPRKQTGGRQAGKKRKPQERDRKLTIFGDIFGI